MKKKYLYIFLAFLIIAMAAVSALILDAIRKKSAPAFAVPSALFPQQAEKSYLEEGTQINEKTFTFDDGGVFSIYRFVFTESTAEEEFSFSIPLKGEDLSIKWQNYDASPYKWEYSGEIDELPKATLFIETSRESIIISIPALYYSRFDHNTIECIPELEMAPEIEETDGGYVINMRYAVDADTIGEAWFYRWDGNLNEWDDGQYSLWLRQDLYKNRRFCYDGYYFRTYENYEPYAVNGFFRNPANFTGAQILEAATGSVRNIGYAMTKICADNQNEYGFWATGPKSGWLDEDYGIGFDFYDTRFSTDFARSLLIGYSAYGDTELMESASRYADFLVEYAEEEGYVVGTLGRGLLVPDYWSDTMAVKPHVSLNHQLCEINFLLEAFIAAGESKYMDCAEKMLLGIENTADEWILEDKNLKYALMYTDSSNIMVDYPYLTYNDLFDLKELLESLNIKSGAVDALMASKKEWMDKNGITEYKNPPE